MYERAIGLWKSASVVSAGDTMDIMAQLGDGAAALASGDGGSGGGGGSDSVEVAYLMSDRRPLAAALSNLASVKRLLGDLDESGQWWHGGVGCCTITEFRAPVNSRPGGPATPRPCDHTNPQSRIPTTLQLYHLIISPPQPSSSPSLFPSARRFNRVTTQRRSLPCTTWQPSSMSRVTFTRLVRF